MRNATLAAWVAFATLGYGGWSTAATKVAGQATYEGHAWTAVDAIAYREGEGEGAKTVVVFSSVPFDRTDFARDQAIDAGDTEWHFPAHAEAYGFRLRVPDDTESRFDVDHLHGAVSSGTYLERTRSVRVATGKAPRISGTLKDAGGAYDFTFDVPVDGQIEASFDGLPQGGGEPGKRVTEFMEALGQNQYSRLASMLHPKRHEFLAPDTVAPSRWLDGAQRRTSCRELQRLTGGYVVGNESLVGFACPYGDDKELHGVAVLYRDGSEWKIVGFLQESIHE
jgi:hypothetical protein